MAVRFSEFARGVQVETAFNVLAVAKRLKAAGKRVIELEIGDSPFPSTASAKAAGVEAIREDRSHYCPSVGLPELREAASRYVNREHGLSTTSANVVVGPGAKVFELLFCEAFLNPGDGVLVFSPYFPTYLPNIARRGARAWLADLRHEREFRPNLDDIERFLRDDPHPKAIFLNSPHNPTGGVARREDLQALGDLIRGRDIAVFSDEPYDQMVWRGKHETLLAQPGMLDQCVAAYTFSKSYSMSGWRVGFAVASEAVVELFSTLLNTSLSCVAPLVQLAAAAALEHDGQERDSTMKRFRDKVELMAAGLNRIEGVRCLDPSATFYLFPSVATVCNRLGMTSHGLAMYLLEGADDRLGVACLGGESFGAAGAGFLRFSCAEPDELLEEALAFLPDAFSRTDRVAAFLSRRPEYRLPQPYPA
ncbi:MAG TPA: aminotransferase class I/II-fold pyridoxal phosphate-dependent enzyme [Pirellulales bacterium]|jgi:aspartate aminotransferase|nr:aminotransferase class I/II-fold pyridoxal phosphate-dependent enzyme [Pirellulales bacterium]